MFRVVQAAIVAIALVICIRPASSQQEPASQLRVYLDCPACDFDFMRTEVAYVDWMRDRADADLHILARSQVTGSGGRLHTLDFIGLRRHAGKGDTLTGGTSVNIARGLSLSFSGNYALVRDQISLPRRNLTPEEVLLRQRQVATSYRYFTSMGFSYRFGSAVQNIVNPRFGSSGGGTVIIM